MEHTKPKTETPAVLDRAAPSGLGALWWSAGIFEGWVRRRGGPSHVLGKHALGGNFGISSDVSLASG